MTVLRPSKGLHERVASSPIFRLTVEQPGEYRVYFWDPRGQTGDYVAIIGRKERFSIEDRSRSARNTRIIRDTEYLHGPCSDME